MRFPFFRSFISGGALAAFLTLVALYLSRFWIWTAPWGNEGLFGVKMLPPGGDLVRSWLTGTFLSDFDILVWGGGTILALSLIQVVAKKLTT